MSEATSDDLVRWLDRQRKAAKGAEAWDLIVMPPAGGLDPAEPVYQVPVTQEDRTAEIAAELRGAIAADAGRPGALRKYIIRAALDGRLLGATTVAVHPPDENATGSEMVPATPQGYVESLQRNSSQKDAFALSVLRQASESVFKAGQMVEKLAMGTLAELHESRKDRADFAAQRREGEHEARIDDRETQKIIEREKRRTRVANVALDHAPIVLKQMAQHLAGKKAGKAAKGKGAGADLAALAEIYCALSPALQKQLEDELDDEQKAKLADLLAAAAAAVRDLDDEGPDAGESTH